MKKKVLISLLVLLALFTITGCGNNDKQGIDNGTSNDTDKEKMPVQELISNNFTCQGKISFMTDFMISYGPVDKDGNKSEDPTTWRIYFTGEYKNDDIANGEYTFVYDKNNHLSSIQGKEVYTKSFSSQVTDEQINEMNREDSHSTMKAYMKNNQAIVEYTLNSEDNFIKLFNVKYLTANELKEALEEKTVLTCDGTKGKNVKKETKTNPETNKQKTLKCYGKVYYAYEEYKFDFIYDSSKKDYTLNNVQKNLTIPDGYNPEEYYIEEEKSNMGQYEMNLNGRTITFNLDKTRAYWNDYKFKNYTYNELKKEFSSDGYTCE